MRNKSAQFVWRPGAEPPRIEAHTDAKLRLLGAYLDRYFDVVCALPHMDVLRIALVDAFAGGGLYWREGSPRIGSPLVMIDAVQRAVARINSGRRKPLRIEARFYFVDADASAMEHLKITLAATDMPQDMRESISLRSSTASDALPAIVREISAWTRSGRSIFFLDQCGYTDVPNRDVRLIYQSLPKSEVVVTYNFGAIYDYMNDNARFLAAMAPFEFSSEHLLMLLKERRRQAGRFFAGRLLGQ
ncbi:MAG: three-Cys-motif partner protein TcmP, partial [Gammaproteobacteria bacterium]|nr:three-Cys-motif partner protein TcmP [Gammaproteobacteria bacterium]